MSAEKPRAAHCTGCGVTFPKMHILINHRRTYRCGGRYLLDDERKRLDDMRLYREHLLREQREDST